MALYLAAIKPPIDILIQDPVEDVVQDTVEMHGLVGEVKMEDIKEDAINECFYNMYGQCINLVMKAITNGHIVSSFTMYGIVVSINKLEEAWLLKLVIDFQDYSCTFSQSMSYSKLAVLLNSVIEELNK